MTENEQAKQQAEPGQPQEPATKPAEAELSDEQLDEVAGGQVTMQDFNFVKKTDKSSPTL